MKHPSHRRAGHMRFGSVRRLGSRADWRLADDDTLVLEDDPDHGGELLRELGADAAAVRHELSPLHNAHVRQVLDACRAAPLAEHEINVAVGAERGRLRWLGLRATATPDDDGLRIAGTLRDITAETVEAAELSGQLVAIDRAQAVIEFGLDGRVLTANANFLAMTGYELGELVGRHHSLFVSRAEHTSRAYREFWDRLASGQYDAGQYARLRADGSTVWIQATYNPIFDPHGRPCKVVKYATDITEHKRRQADVEGQLAALDKALAVIEFELDGTIRTANRNFLEMTGYTLEELWGRHHSLFVHPAERDSAAYQSFWRRLGRGEYDAGQYRRLGRDGREIWIQASYNPILGPDGEPVKVVKYATDITEHRRRQADVEGQLSAIDRTRCILELTMDGRILAANDNFLAKMGYARDELIGRPHAILLDDDDAQGPAQRLLWEHLRRGRDQFGEYRRRRRDGRMIWVEASYHAICDPTGQPVKVVKYSHDVSRRKTVELELVRSEQRLRGLFELSAAGIALVDAANGEIVQANDALAACTGLARDALLGRSIDALFAEEEEARAHWAAIAEIGRYGPKETEFVRRESQRYPVQVASLRVNDHSGRSMVWATVEDITDRRRMQRALSRAAHRDALTGLANRAAFLEALQCAIRAARADADRGYAVLFLDFDRFKLLNDTLGHDAGDELLRQIAQRLRRVLRAQDLDGAPGSGNLVARFGGDEFAILVSGAGVQAVPLAERILNALVGAYRIKGQDVHSSASIGIVTSGAGEASADEVMRNADVAMYEAKRLGRGRAVVFNEAMHALLTRHLRIETALRQALGTAQFTLEYQPIVDLSTGACVSAEALLRWHHPDLGAIAPGEFVPVAEESGLILPIGEWVLREACRQFVQWRRADPAHAPRSVSVNLSRVQLGAGEQLLARIGEILADTGMPGTCLQLEVTEREVMRDPGASRRLMSQLRSFGIRLAMDDFGTGTSSLGCLREYPFDCIKIDRSFVADVERNPDVLSVLHATVTLVENLGMTSVAEGLEHASQIAILQAIGCRYAQGFHFSVPVDGDGLLRFAASADARVRTEALATDAEAG